MDLSPEQFMAGMAIFGLAFKVIGTLVDALVERVSPHKDTIIRFSAEFETKFAQMVERIMAIDLSTRHLERTADGINELNNRFEEHDKEDAVWHSRVIDSIIAINGKLDSHKHDFDEHDRRVMEAVGLQRQINENTRK